jgi:serine phosphatase RsbU (regulator of sigma subunit)/anti-sigma regulatory factor (Ser/Thr protein kinase)
VTWLSAILAATGTSAALLCAAAALWWARSRRILASKRHLETVFDHVDPMVVVDVSFRVLRANRAFATLLGRSWNDLLGHHIDQVLGSFLPPEIQLTGLLDRTTFAERPWPGPGGDRVFDLHVVPVGPAEGMVLHLQETTQLAHARQELLARNAALARLTQALQGEIEVAREIQSGLLPRELPRVGGIEFLVRYLPSRPVGGDLYDVLPLDDTHLGIFIADVSGHGLPAAFEAALVRMSFLNRAQPGLLPSQVLGAMNRDLRRSLAVGHYATAFYGILDLETLSLTYCRASHPRPAVLRADGQVLRLGSQGLFLGIVDAANYRDSTVQLANGDRFCLFTDGYYEGLRRDGKRLGYDGFLKRIFAPGEGGLADELTRIEEEFEPGTDDESAEDDRTFLSMDILSERPRWLPRVLLRLPDAPLPRVRTFSSTHQSWELVEAFAAELEAAGWSARDVRKAQLAASEIAVNALVHGLRDQPNGEVRCAWAVESHECRFAVEDDGPGFDPDRIPDPRSPERLALDHGRGIFLVRRIVADLWYDHGGSTATFLLRPTRPEPAPPPQET